MDLLLAGLVYLAFVVFGVVLVVFLFKSHVPEAIGTKFTLIFAGKPANLVMPTAEFVYKIRDRCVARRSQLAFLWREHARSFGLRWGPKSVTDRAALLDKLKDDALRVLAGYLAGDMAILDAMCPELDTLALASSEDAVARLIQRLADGKKLPDPKSTEFAELTDGLKAYTAGLEKRADKDVAMIFIPTLRASIGVAMMNGVLRTVCSLDGEGDSKDGESFLGRLVQGSTYAAVMFGLSFLVSRLLPHILGATAEF
eukprot:gnl/Hemi2/13589_TR4636_c0_g1_i1.p1 gnl/Hemi2/13589_TR4636_c0_g1~~gnl/Hemi2/13589_TR4636_c0_g1_i1.p1  ORF type:complete len:272 (+),score=76.76 gnl/Hemi2/13589_TR4636_c0_g1_i1:50-817(+)